MTHDYKRHGTTLFAALDVKSGLVIAECLPRHPLPGSGLHANHEKGGQRVPALLAPHRLGGEKTPRCASCSRLLRPAQDARGSGMAGETSTIQATFHADQRVVAEHGRRVLRRDHVKAHPARQLHKRRRPGDRHLRLPGATQCKAKALDQDRRRHSRKRTARAGQTRENQRK
jgi:hypothetical protein